MSWIDTNRSILSQMTLEQLKYNYTVQGLQSLIDKTPPMEEDLRLLSEARAEIVRLRRDNELMKARLDMFDTVVAMRQPYSVTYQNGYSASVDPIFKSDLVNQLNEFINARTITDKVLKDNGGTEPELEGIRFTDALGRITTVKVQ